MVGKHKNIWLGLFVVFSSTFSFAQLDLNNNAIFKSAEVLENHKIERITEDPLGFIWIATQRNIFRFDGLSLDPFYKGTFVEILRDRINNRMIFVHRKGLYIYNYISGKESNISLKTINGKEDNVLSATFLNNTNETLLIGCNNGFLEYDLISKTYTFKQVNNKLNRATTFLALHKESKNDSILWMGSRKAGLFKYNLLNNTYNQIVFKNINPQAKEEANTITQIVQKDNILYLGTWDGGYLIFNTKNNSYKQYFIEPQNGIKPRDHVHRIFKTEKERLWLSSTKGALLLDHKTGKQLYHLSVNGVLNEFNNAPQFIDSKQRIWQGHRSGIRVIDTLRIKTKTIKNPMHDISKWNIPKNIIRHKETQTLYFCVFGSKGIYSYALLNKKWKLIEPDKPLKTGIFMGLKIIHKKETLLILEESGIYSLKFGSSKLKKIIIQNQESLGKLLDFTLYDNNHVLILTSFNGVFKINLTTGKIERFDRHIREQFPDVIRFQGDIIHKDSLGNIWIGWKNNLFLQTPKDSLINVTPSFKMKNGINNVKHLNETQTHMYLSLQSGIYSIDKTTLPKLNIQKVNNDDSNYSLLDNSGKLWWLFDGLKYKSSKSEYEVLFNESDGLHNPGKYGYEFLSQIDDEIVVGSRGVYSFFKQEDVQKSTYIPIPYIKKITVDGLNLKKDSTYSLIKQMTLKPNENNITIQFSAQAFYKPLDTRFRYKLSGINKNWQYSSSNNRLINYANLRDKNYEFILQASIDNIIWSKPTILKIKNRIPFYASNWFFIVSAILIFSILILIHKLRIKNIRYKAKSREQLLNLEKQALRAQMNPHFVFNAMNSIQHLITEGNEEKSINFLNKFSKLLRGVLENSQNPRTTLENEIGIIKNYLELEFLRLGDRYTYQFYVDETLLNEHLEIPGLLFQPLIENAIHHGLAHKKEGGHLKVELHDKDDHIFCVIEDNGIGRQRARQLSGWQHHKSAGISMVQKRIDLLSNLSKSNLIHILDLYDGDNPSGTRVELKIPLNGSYNNHNSR